MILLDQFAKILAFLAVLATVPTARAEVTNSSSLSVIGTHQNSTVTDSDSGFFSLVNQASTWTFGKSLSSEGDLQLAALAGNNQSSRSLNLNEDLQWRTRASSTTVSVAGNYSVLEGFSFLSLNDQFEQNQTLDIIAADPNAALERIELSGQARWRYQIGRNSEIAISQVINETSNRSIVTEQSNEQQINLQTQRIEGEIALQPQTRLIASVSLSNLELSTVTTELDATIKQTETITQGGLRLVPNQTLSCDLTAYQQLIKIDEDTTTAIGPAVALSFRPRRTINVRLNSSLLNIDYSDGTARQFTNFGANFDLAIRRSKSLSLSIQHSINNSGDVFELLNNSDEDFPRRGYETETAAISYNQELRSLSSTTSFSHTNLYVGDRTLSFRETLGQSSLSWRLNLDHSLGALTSLRQRQSFDENQQASITRIIGLGVLYNAGFDYDESTLTQGQFFSGFNIEGQTSDINNDRTLRASLNTGMTFNF